ncbi:MAG: hypothetical protein HYY92_01335 [Parcubacteria group bacterium]|nr:hypothetical protein [Parcubacteria group bacterium]
MGTSLYHSGDIVVNVRDTPQIEYTLTCYGFLGVNCDTDETRNPAALDTVTITPSWNPPWSTPVDLTGPIEAASGDDITLYYKMYDIKSCIQTSPADRTWWGAAQNSSIITGNTQPSESGGIVQTSAISADTTFALSCVGFDDNIYTDSKTVRRVPDAPFFFVAPAAGSNIIVTLGTGAGATSNKVSVEVWSGGGFAETVTLSASGVPTGFAPRFSQSTIPCSGDAERCGTSDFWVEVTGSGQTEGVYPITINATSDSETKTTTINLRVRRFTPAFEEI